MGSLFALRRRPDPNREVDPDCPDWPPEQLWLREVQDPNREWVLERTSGPQHATFFTTREIAERATLLPPVFGERVDVVEFREVVP